MLGPALPWPAEFRRVFLNPRWALPARCVFSTSVGIGIDYIE